MAPLLGGKTVGPAHCLSFYFLNYTTWRGERATAFVWTSEDNLWESVLLSPGDQIEVLKLKRRAPLPDEPSRQPHLFILFGWTRRVDTPRTSFSPPEQLLSVSFQGPGREAAATLQSP